ncbi:MAG TPA: anhydro-N-acetylmuramic acid kinase [Fontimonas sp.]
MSALSIGLMSGTSMDAVDAALCRIEQGRVAAVLATFQQQYPTPLRERLLAIQRMPQTLLSLHDYAELDHGVAEQFALAGRGVIASAGLEPAAIRVIGSHGQTVFHDPKGVINSLQLGDPSWIAARCAVPVVADFRRADIALGGQGAPLVPAYHAACFMPLAPCSVLNIGGIANLTLLNAPDAVLGFDTGPGNGLMDEWIGAQRSLRYDDNGRWAASGRVNASLLQACLKDPFFELPPPKSTGRDRFNLDWLRRCFADLDALPAADVQSSLCELTARSIATQLSRHAPTHRRLLVCGGGARNQELLSRLQALLPAVQVERTEAHGIDGGTVEAAAFAWLAWQRLEGLPGSIAGVTGASRAARLGGLYQP